MEIAELQESFFAFREQCIWLRICYNTYWTLYESGQETKELLETSASLFFGDLNRILIEYILLQACKITDPEDTRGRKNLTVEHLNTALRVASRMTDEITRLSDDLFHYRHAVKAARDRLISHLDKDAILAGRPIGEHAQEEVTAFFESLSGYVNAVGEAVEVGPLDFKTTAGAGDVLDLIEALKRGESRSSIRDNPNHIPVNRLTTRVITINPSEEHQPDLTEGLLNYRLTRRNRILLRS
jgi:hypothetical protein